MRIDHGVDFVSAKPVHGSTTLLLVQGFKSGSKANSNSNSYSGSISYSNSNAYSSPEHSSEPSPKPNHKTDPEPNPTYANVKFDVTNKVCNKCKVTKQIISFDKKKSVCLECNSKTVNCKYFSSIISFCVLKSHIKIPLRK